MMLFIGVSIAVNVTVDERRVFGGYPTRTKLRSRWNKVSGWGRRIVHLKNART